jgi:hypothetical protein
MQPITNTTRWLQQTLHTHLTPRDLYEQQDLFSIYVHRTPGYEEHVTSSIFYGRDIDNRCASASCAAQNAALSQFSEAFVGRGITLQSVLFSWSRVPQTMYLSHRQHCRNHSLHILWNVAISDCTPFLTLVMRPPRSWSIDS